MDALFLLVLVVGPTGGTYALRKTPVFWAPSAVLLLLGSAELGTMYGIQGTARTLRKCAR
jgi:hypothetical protein